MDMYRLIIAAVGLSLSLLCSASGKQADSVLSVFDEINQSTKNLPDLTSSQVKKWITSYKASEKLNMPELKEAVRDGEQSTDDILQRVKGSKQYGKLSSIIKSAGFKDVEQWTNVGMQVMQAYAALTVNKKEVNQQLKESIAEIKSNTGLSEQQKQFMLNMAQQAGGMVDSLTNAPEANKRAVKAHQAELSKLFDDK